MALALRLLALLALLLMPLGMTARAEPHAAMPMAHCPDQAPAHHPRSVSLECAMACAAALPAVERAIGEQLALGPIAGIAAAQRPLHGLHPETATPPPRQA